MLMKTVSISEFIDWIAFFRLEHEDQTRAQQDAEDRSRAQQMARQLSGFR
jgi:hypothetical protein